jgi:tripartite-type tricarboxylate transporter receptor subunit TctC
MDETIRVTALMLGLCGVAVQAIAQTVSTSPVSEQQYPSRPIRLVVPFAAGGPIDIMARPLAQKLNEAMGTPVVVDNRAGAQGIIGTSNVAKSLADGYSLLVASGGVFAIGPHVHAKLPYDLFKDFAPVSLFAIMPELLAVHPALPVKSVKELVALAKSRPNRLNFGSAGTGGTPHLAGEMLKLVAQIQMVHVPYKGMGPATIDLIAGQVQLAFADLPVLLPYVNAGKLRALAVGTTKRSANLPNVPTMAEAGFPQIEAYNWYSLFAPAGTPKEIIARLNAETVRVVGNSDVKAFMQAQGAEAAGSTPEALAAMHRREFDKWGAVVKAAGIKAE